MTNVEIIEDYNGVEHAVITDKDGSFTAMPKAVYDAQVELSTEIIPTDEA